MAKAKGYDKLARKIFDHLAQNYPPKKKLTLIRVPVSALQTFTSPRSDPLTIWVLFILTTLTALLCFRVLRHFPLCRLHTVRDKGGKY